MIAHLALLHGATLRVVANGADGALVARLGAAGTCRSEKANNVSHEEASQALTANASGMKSINKHLGSSRSNNVTAALTAPKIASNQRTSISSATEAHVCGGCAHGWLGATGALVGKAAVRDAVGLGVAGEAKLAGQAGVEGAARGVGADGADTAGLVVGAACGAGWARQQGKGKDE